ALDLIWDVFAVDEGDVPASKTGSKATISSVTPATGTKTSTKYATINFTPGTVDYAEYEVAGVKYDDNTVAASSLTITETSVKVDTTTSGFKAAEAFALVFTNEDTGDTYEVSITDALF
ncbi:MAG: hypothetical protein IJQ25_08670, partial [Oscillibacter sp.]|nr:hypothetical protein [Oscillibacter sp.]